MKLDKYLDCGIYQIRNLLDGKRYIGSSVELRRRGCVHFSKLRRGVHENQYLQRAFNKYGEENFAFEILCYTEKDKKYINDTETGFIKIYKTANPDFGYNLREIADSNFGVKHSEAAKQKQSDHNKGKKHSEETKLLMRKPHHSFSFSEPRSEQHKKNISIAKTGKKITIGEDRKQQLLDQTLGSNNMNAKLNEESVLEIKKLFLENVSTREIAKIYNVSISAIGRIRKGDTWKQVRLN